MKLIMKLFINIVILICSTAFVYAQRVGIEEWRDHLPYGSCLDVAKVGHIAYGATYFGLIKYDIEDNSVSKISKVNGLSDIGISTIEADDNLKILVVAYQNGNIDLIKEDESIVNIPDIKRKNIVGSKCINDIMFYDGKAYLSSDFGIVVINLLKEEILETYWSKYNNSILEIYSSVVYSNYIYSASAKGLFYCNMNKNLADFNNWEKDNTLNFPDSIYKCITSIDNKLLISMRGIDHDTVYSKTTNTNWSVFSEFKRVYSMKEYYNHLVVSNEWFTTVYDKSLNQVRNIYTYFNNNNPAPNSAFFDSKNELWIADRNSGMIYNKKDWDLQIIIPQGPETDRVCKIIEDKNGRILYSAGGINASWNNQYYKYGISYFENEKWNVIRDNKDSIFDILDVAVSPLDESLVYAATWGGGIIEFTGGVVSKYWNSSNSTLKPYTLAADNTVRVGGLYFDNNNNLWIGNSNSKSQLSVKTSTGDWISYSFGSSLIDQHIGKIKVDNNDRKWIQLGNEKGLLVFDENKTIEDKSDDNYIVLTNSAENGNLSGTTVNDFAFDKDDEVWIGTDIGVCVIYNPSDVFESYFKGAEKILIDQTGQAQYLLETEEVTSIAIDAANRKWIGTSKAGVFLLSVDGTKEVYHFSEENSPLLSNTITSIAINNKTGEVFIGTDKGLIGFMGTATEGNSNNDNVLVFPNPVKDGYSGIVGIRGLVENANVKITDIEGNLVADINAEGGQAIWDQKNLNGNLVSSGVYLIFCTDSEGKENSVSKIAIIRK